MIIKSLRFLNRKDGKMKKGFTLAEVLITLGIIGIIAAMTIPTVVNKYKKQTYVIGLKKAYNNLLVSLNQVKYTNNISSLEEINWNTSKESIDGKEFQTAYERNIYIIYKSFSGATYMPPNSNKCLYKTYSNNVDGTQLQTNYNLCKDGGFIAADGILYAEDGAYIFVDINGKEKGPNFSGRDIFRFQVDTKKAIVFGRPGWDSNIGYCMKDPSKSHAVWGSYCTARVLTENAMNY